MLTLLAVSGGPDSMFLLEKYKKDNIIVAHVNYHQRTDSDYDQQVVENFCQRNDIPLKVLHVRKKLAGNFQNAARELRYQFFSKLYKKHHCSLLLIAHNKDDFIETALMQRRSRRKPRFFGIKKENFLYDMHIRRPLVDVYWKDQIKNTLIKNNFPFAVDSSNSDIKYERNKLRLKISKLTRDDKEKIFQNFMNKNENLELHFKKVDATFEKWKEQKFAISFFKTIKTNLRVEIIFLFIHTCFEEVKLGKKKIESIIEFVLAQAGNKRYRLNKTALLLKQKGLLVCLVS